MRQSDDMSYEYDDNNTLSFLANSSYGAFSSFDKSAHSRVNFLLISVAVPIYVNDTNELIVSNTMACSAA
jgi:hypothetical protein